MSNSNFRTQATEKEITLRASEDTQEDIISNRGSEKTSATPRETAATPEDVALRETTQADTQNQSKSATQSTSDPHDLFDVITDPHAGEQDWISACYELERQDRRKQQQEYNARQNKEKDKKKFTVVAVTILAIIAASFCVSNFFQSGQRMKIAATEQTQSDSVEKKINFKPYMKSLQKEIRLHWHPQASDVSKKIQVHFKIAKTGEISNIGFDRLSRDSEADAAVLKSVIESMPNSPPLPEGSPESVDVSFTFDYEVNKSNKH